MKALLGTYEDYEHSQCILAFLYRKKAQSMYWNMHWALCHLKIKQ